VSKAVPVSPHNKHFLAISVHAHYESSIYRAAMEPLAHVSMLCDVVLPRCTLMFDLQYTVV